MKHVNVVCFRTDDGHLFVLKFDDEYDSLHRVCDQLEDWARDPLLPTCTDSTALTLFEAARDASRWKDRHAR